MSEKEHQELLDGSGVLYGSPRKNRWPNPTEIPYMVQPRLSECFGFCLDHPNPVRILDVVT